MYNQEKKQTITDYRYSWLHPNMSVITVDCNYRLRLNTYTEYQNKIIV